MKKVLFVVAIAAIAMTACTNEKNEYVGDNSPKEITFKPLAQVPTRTAVPIGGSFPESYGMYVAAAKAGASASTDYFDGTLFSKNSSGKWAAAGYYWPLAESTFNFLAITAGPGSTTRTFGTSGSGFVGKVETTMANNKSAQHDLMWAIGQGSVSVSAGVWSFPDVTMVFKHALAWVNFTEKVDASSTGNIKLISITLNGAKYSGKYTVTNPNSNLASGASPTAPTTAWSDLPSGDGENQTVPGWTTTTALTNTTASDVGDGLLIIPQSTSSFTSFTVVYQVKRPGSTDTWDEYTYTYTPTEPTNLGLEEGKKYTYNITFKLHEILITPSVTNWTTGSTDVDIL